MNVVGVIPARYQSSRFPGKPLADIHGKPMIWWVYHKSIKSYKLNCVLVATDDERIMDVCNRYNIPCRMTETYNTAVDRIWEISESIHADFYVNINGDEPLVEPRVIEASIPEYIPQDIEFATNVITESDGAVEILDPSNIKMVFDHQMNCLYMSRNPIPNPYGTLDFKYHKHIGVIGFNKKMLDFYHQADEGKYEKIEGLNLLRILDYGKRLKLMYCPNCKTLSVDTPKDLGIIRNIMPPPLIAYEFSNKVFIASSPYKRRAA